MEDYSIEPVTSSDDINALATVFLKATTETDTFWEMISRYGPDQPFETFLNVLRESYERPDHHLFKAVHNATGEVVGMAQWKAPWYLEIEKVDPFASSQNMPAGDANVAPLPPNVKEPDDPAKAAGVASFEDTKRQIGNAYITHIRGKKHVFLGRMGVLPEHQRRGIASRLMQWGTDFADANGIVAFLNGRPAALKLYENLGFKAVYVTHFKFDDLEVGPVTSMLRLPLAGRKVEQ